MDKYVVFGAGRYAQNFINTVGGDNIAFIVDNDSEKEGLFIDNVPVLTYSSDKKPLKDYRIVIAVSDIYYKEIENQLINDGITSYMSMGQAVSEIKKEYKCSKKSVPDIYKRAISWVKENTIDGSAIICNTNLKLGYPEVTGYYIPSLIRWGYKDLAKAYAKWLLTIQNTDGSWNDVKGENAYIFDTAQILKGLLAARNIVEKCDEIDKAIIKGCDWILSCASEEGRLITPSKKEWGEDESVCSELIHLYCLSPIKEAGELFNNSLYIESADKILNYYIDTYYDKILHFNMLSHFHAYVMEALLDMGCEDLCREAMKDFASFQKSNGAIPAYKDVDWVCSTGIFQYAVVCYRLNSIAQGDKAFDYACSLQNESGGWFGSYLDMNNAKEVNTYFPCSEISWANKYFLDALYYRNISCFNNISDSFMSKIDKKDGRYVLIKKEVEKYKNSTSILDVGCGKGRYLKNLVEEYPQCHFVATDISESVLETFECTGIEKKQGSLTNLSIPSNSVDLAYSCEALEHAVDCDSALKEICRVVRPGGEVIIIDKNIECLGCLEIGKCEQWFDVDELKEKMYLWCSDVEVILDIPYENNPISNLFFALIGTVKEGKK